MCGLCAGQCRKVVLSAASSNTNGAVGGIEGDEYRADLGRGKLRDHPLRAVGGPDTSAVTLPDTEVKKPSCRTFYF
jgi:hypothetical protein